MLINGNTLRTWNGMIVSGSALGAQGGPAGHFNVKIEGKKGMAVIALEDIWAATSEVRMSAATIRYLGAYERCNYPSCDKPRWDPYDFCGNTHAMMA